jgi:hypothetical protein
MAMKKMEELGFWRIQEYPVAMVTAEHQVKSSHKIGAGEIGSDTA